MQILVTAPPAFIAWAAHHETTWRDKAQNKFRRLVFITPTTLWHTAQITHWITNSINAAGEIDHHVRCRADKRNHLDRKRRRVEIRIVLRHRPCHAMRTGLHGRVHAIARQRTRRHARVRVLVIANRIHPHIGIRIIARHRIVDIHHPVPRIPLLALDVGHFDL